MRNKILFGWVALMVMAASLGASTASAAVGGGHAALSFDGVNDKVTTSVNIDQSANSTGATFSARVLTY